SDYVYAQFIAKQLYPEAFQDVDPVKNLQDYYKKWLPIEADGVFMTQYQTAK
ncbi:MAG: iron ABC transporter substrate-binding protein, partial [Cardiobacterium sp.]